MLAGSGAELAAGAAWATESAVPGGRVPLIITGNDPLIGFMPSIRTVFSAIVLHLYDPYATPDSSEIRIALSISFCLVVAG